MTLAGWTIDYPSLVAGAANMQEKRNALGNGILEQSVLVYTRQVGRPVCLQEIPCGSFFYGLDYYSFLELKQQAPLSDTIDDRVFFVLGSAAPALDARHARVRLRGLIGNTEKRFGPQYDKGHFIARTIGGGTEVNIFPQRRDLNRGWSIEGKLFRSMEQYCQDHPGTLCFNRPIYLDESMRPAAFDFGLLKEDGELWVAQFDNQEIPVDGGFFQNRILPGKELNEWRASLRKRDSSRTDEGTDVHL